VEATEATMIQFDLYGSCSSLGSYGQLRDHSLPSISVEYSSDEGKSWNLVRELCAPPDTSCSNYGLPSIFTPPVETDEGLRREKRRVVLELPKSVS